MPETAPKDRPMRSARDLERGSPSLAPLRVSYYRRMKPQRVYPWVVTWQRSANDRKGPDQDVTLRLLMAGAQVVPVEQTINASDANARATFYVTPLAKGWLRAQRLEVLVGGRKVQEIPLASQVVSQRGTLVLLALTFLLPWLIWNFIQSNTLLGSKTVVEKGKPIQEGKESPVSTIRTQTVLPYKRAEAMEKLIRELVPNVPALLEEDPPEPTPTQQRPGPEARDNDNAKAPKDEAPTKRAKDESNTKPPKDESKPPKDESKPPKDESKPPKDESNNKAKGKQIKGLKVGGMPKMPMGGMPKMPKGDMAQFLQKDESDVSEKEEGPQTWRSSVKTTLEKDVPKTVGKFLVDVSDFSRELKLPTYVFLLFLLLTIASALCCRQKRKNAYGRPIPLSIAGGQGGVME